jgi:hypothetical protein
MKLQGQRGEKPIVGLKVTQWGGPPLSETPPFRTRGINTTLPTTPSSQYETEETGNTALTKWFLSAVSIRNLTS